MKSNQSNKCDGVLIRDAALDITQVSNRHCGTDALRKAAKRLGVYDTDEQGRGVIPRPIVEEMKRNYAAMGYLIRRLQPSAERAG
jgi:hypothetical protein